MEENNNSAWYVASADVDGSKELICSPVISKKTECSCVPSCDAKTALHPDALRGFVTLWLWPLKPGKDAAAVKFSKNSQRVHQCSDLTFDIWRINLLQVLMVNVSNTLKVLQAG